MQRMGFWSLKPWMTSRDAEEERLIDMVMYEHLNYSKPQCRKDK